MPDSPLRLLILGAHPDDAEYHAGGLVTLYRSAGHAVKIVSVTCGDAGHHRLAGPELAAIRAGEARNSAAIVGAVAETWEFHDGLLEPTLEVRERIIREIRQYQPDLVLTHRTNDYHPDHRAVGHAVRDACYMITVPAIVPQVPIPARHPVVAFPADRFTKPNPIQPDVIIDVTDQVERIIDMLGCHRSQFFEWLPFNRGVLDQVPADEPGRRAWLKKWYLRERAWIAERFQQEITAMLGPSVNAAARNVEVYEISEHGSALDPATRLRLFPWTANRASPHA